MESDWRLTNQEKYLQGVRFEFKSYQKPRPDWDHDHCSFCMSKFAPQEEIPDALHEGYASRDIAGKEDGYYWVCKGCFDDFKDQFGWKVDQNPSQN